MTDSTPVLDEDGMMFAYMFLTRIKRNWKIENWKFIKNDTSKIVILTAIYEAYSIDKIFNPFWVEFNQ